ncbi:ribosomal protein S18-alanine N-acetyltransferase [Candidatus Palauibacter sp.]|uniref:ribosomal protein S18-alanine N-acetyltransferase n=1 Tax=Candidatus Palauibacter sp. TaxID=3101350 RepID=UPI003B5B9532
MADPGSSPSALRIRPLVKADLPEVTTIEEACFATPWSEQTFRNLLRRPNACLLSALDENERVVGYAAVWFAGRAGELGDLAVASAARRRGIGTRLVEAVLSEARLRGARQIILDVREGNRSAQSLYRGHGFDIVGRRPRYYAGPTEDALIMRRLLIR